MDREAKGNKESRLMEIVFGKAKFLVLSFLFERWKYFVLHYWFKIESEYWERVKLQYTFIRINTLVETGKDELINEM